MVKCGDWPIGVCSWSLKGGATELAELKNELGIEHLHLAAGPALGEDGRRYLSEIQKQGWTISCTMIDFPQEDYSTLESIKATGGIAPDDCWQQNEERFTKAIDVTAELGVQFISMHAGFIEVGSSEHAAKFFDRMRFLAYEAASRNIKLLMETGQETADELKRFLEELAYPALAINFDPANVILYNKGEPIESVRKLAPWIEHIHIKDAVRTEQPGTWGSEVPWGDGETGAERFLQTLKEINYEGVLSIERETGEDVFGDIRSAVEKLTRFEKKIR